MIRVLFAIIFPLILPAAAYILWRSFAPPRIGGSKAIHQGNWEEMPWVTLALIGVALLAVSMGYIAVAGAEPPRGGDS